MSQPTSTNNPNTNTTINPLLVPTPAVSTTAPSGPRRVILRPGPGRVATAATSPAAPVSQASTSLAPALASPVVAAGQPTKSFGRCQLPAKTRMQALLAAVPLSSAEGISANNIVSRLKEQQSWDSLAIRSKREGAVLWGRYLSGLRAAGYITSTLRPMSVTQSQNIYKLTKKGEAFLATAALAKPPVPKTAKHVPDTVYAYEALKSLCLTNGNACASTSQIYDTMPEPKALDRQKLSRALYNLAVRPGHLERIERRPHPIVPVLRVYALTLSAYEALGGRASAATTPAAPVLAPSQAPDAQTQDAVVSSAIRTASYREWLTAFYAAGQPTTLDRLQAALRDLYGRDVSVTTQQINGYRTLAQKFGSLTADGQLTAAGVEFITR
jgi:hypothetical protein